MAWAQKEGLRSPRGLRSGNTYDAWAIEGGLSLYRHRGFVDRLLGWLFALLDRLFAPFRYLRARLDAYVVRLAARFGPLFAILSLPLALLGFVADAFTLFVALIRALPTLILSPITLLREILAIPFHLAMALLSRLVRTLVLSWLGPWLQTRSGIEEQLRRHPWLRGVILGFLRCERPDYPVLIPAASVSQVLRVSRLGVFGKKEYLIVVEGSPLEKGLGASLRLKIKQVILPFYWERTVHMLRLPKGERDVLVRGVCRAVGKTAAEWN